MRSYLLRSLFPFLIVLAISIGGLIGILNCISTIENRLDRPTPFDLSIGPLGDAPFWLLLLGGLLIINGLVMSEARMASAEWGKRESYGFELSIPFPLGRLAAANAIYVGASIFVFYGIREYLI